MSPVTTEPTGMASLQARVTAILTQPQQEWPIIAAERTDVASLYRNYIAVLAAIPPAATFIGLSIIGISLPLLGTYRYSIPHGITMAVVSYVLSLVGVYVAALVVDKLAPTFQSQSDQMQALKLVAYASTPGWVAGVLHVIPALGILVVLASLYGVYLFYLGVQPTMKTPGDKVIPYMIVSALVIIVVMAVVGVCTTAITGALFVGPRLF